MIKHNPNVKFTLEQLDEIDYIVTAYMGGRTGKYIHDYTDFKDWLRHQKDLVAYGVGKNPNKCELCAGDPAKTPGGCRCESCYIVGTSPWGG